MNKQDIIAHISAEIYAIECEHAWREAPFTGGTDLSRFYASDVPWTISQLIWETDNGLGQGQKVELMFEIYADLPCYSLLADLYIHGYRDLPEDALAIYWQHIVALLGQPEQALAQPVVYNLAVDFFEDPEQCSHVWNRLVTAQAPDRLFTRILEASAAVPFVLKEQIYRRLLRDPAWHAAIYISILTSYNSVYGDIDKVHAEQILQQLSIPLESEGLAALQQALQIGDRYANYYADRQDDSSR